VRQRGKGGGDGGTWLGVSSGAMAEAGSSNERFGRPCLTRERANREQREGVPGFQNGRAGCGGAHA
jgi:hypothetical protein